MRQKKLLEFFQCAIVANGCLGEPPEFVGDIRSVGCSALDLLEECAISLERRFVRVGLELCDSGREYTDRLDTRGLSDLESAVSWRCVPCGAVAHSNVHLVQTP